MTAKTARSIGGIAAVGRAGRTIEGMPHPGVRFGVALIAVALVAAVRLVGTGVADGTPFGSRRAGRTVTADFGG